MTEGDRIKPGDRVQFAEQDLWWLARAATQDGRYVICTHGSGASTLYTIIDYSEDVRGAMNVIGYGLKIRTKSGPDPAIDEAVEMLSGGWEVSHRNRVGLHVASVVRAAA